MDISKQIIGLQGPNEPMKLFLEMIQKGDPRCRFQLWDRVYKARKIEENDLTPIGTRGTIVGSVYVDDPNSKDKDAYWLIWDGNPVVITSVGRRLERLETKAPDSYRLADAFVMNILHPRTFEIPDKDELEALQPGEYVKLCFERRDSVPKGQPNAERMWVRIQKVSPEGLTGFLDNDPVVIRELKADHIVDFEYRNIYQIQKTEGIGLRAFKI